MVVTVENLAIYKEATDLLLRAQRLASKAEIGATEATWSPKLDYPELPIALLLATDIHYGALHTDYEMLNAHMDIVENTPNFYIATNGDDVDNFNVTGKWATGCYENPLPPQLQTLAWLEKFKSMDKQGKVAVMSFGNHNLFMNTSGYDWFQTFARDIQAPVFTSGGYLHMIIGKEYYGMALTHKYWGTSKLNPTNVAKRFWEHEYPQAEIVFLGHTHQSELLNWERAGKKRIACIGGTYKQGDKWARQNGIGGRSGQPGHCVLLWPKQHKLIGISDIEVAQQFILGNIFQEEYKNSIK